MVDPSTIIEWSAGLRCVMKTVAQHDQLLNEVRKVSLHNLFGTEIGILIVTLDDQKPT